jgi:hypothetical protein
MLFVFAPVVFLSACASVDGLSGPEQYAAQRFAACLSELPDADAAITEQALVQNIQVCDSATLLLIGADVTGGTLRKAEGGSGNPSFTKCVSYVVKRRADPRRAPPASATYTLAEAQGICRR